jgi:hypothetical protein
MSRADGRHECDIEGCGKPSVDYIEQPVDPVTGCWREPPLPRLWLCAEHWDRETKL